MTLVGSAIAAIVVGAWAYYTYQPTARTSAPPQKASVPIERPKVTVDTVPRAKDEPAARSDKSQCETPLKFLRRVFSSDGKTIEYDLQMDSSWSALHVAFFGQRGVVLRPNTYVRLKASTGSFVIPSGAFAKPEQKWFNFVASRTDGCEQWAIVSEEIVSASGNRIRIDNPSNEGHSFVVSPNLLEAIVERPRDDAARVGATKVTPPASSITEALAAANQITNVGVRDSELERLALLALKRKEHAAALQATFGIRFVYKTEGLLDLIHCYATFLGDPVSAREALRRAYSTDLRNKMLMRSSKYYASKPGEGSNDIDCKPL
jgi:hypothetical protein